MRVARRAASCVDVNRHVSTCTCTHTHSHKDTNFWVPEVSAGEIRSELFS